MRTERARAAAWLLAASCAATLAHANPAARFLPASPVDCTGPANFVSQSAPAPTGITYMRVQHIGDAGTEEQAQQVAHPVTWDVSQFTGLAAPAAMQRGYRDRGPPQPSSAFQLWCDRAGFYMDSWSFRHASPLTGEGPSISLARDYDPPVALFDGAQSIVMEATVRVPHVRVQQLPVVTWGTAQVSFFQYVRDRVSGVYIAQLVQLFDNRVPGTSGAATEYLGSDGVVAFMSSPLLPQDANGRAVRFITPAGEERMRSEPWAQARDFRVVITRENFQAAIDELRAGPLPQISPHVEDYGLTLFGILGEIFPGPGDANNVALGASVERFRLSRVPARPLVAR